MSAVTSTTPLGPRTCPPNQRAELNSAHLHAGLRVVNDKPSRSGNRPCNQITDTLKFQTPLVGLFAMPKSLSPLRSPASAPVPPASSAADSSSTPSSKRAASPTSSTLLEQRPPKRQMLGANPGAPEAFTLRPAATLPPGRSASPIKPEAVAASDRAEHHERLRKLTRDDLQAAALALRASSRANKNCVTLANGMLEFLKTGVTPEPADPRDNDGNDFLSEVMFGPQQRLIKQEPDGDDDHQRPRHVMTSTVIHHGDRLAGFIPADPVDSVLLNAGTIQMLDHVVFEVDRYSQPFMQFNEAPAILKELARRCARADQDQGPPAIYGLINLASVTANTAGHQLAYFARPDEVLFIDCQWINNGRGQAVQPALDALCNFGQTGAPAAFQSKIFVVPSYPFVAAQTLREVLNGSPPRRDAPGAAAAMSIRSPLVAAPWPAPVAAPQQLPWAMNPFEPVGMFPFAAPANDRAIAMPNAAGPERAPLAAPGGNLHAPAPALQPWQMQQLVQRFGDAKALDVAQHCGPSLMAPPPLGLGMPMDKILSIGACRGGASTLAVVSQNAATLRTLELPLDDIVKVASYDFSPPAGMQALIAHAPALRALGMSPDHIGKVASSVWAGPAAMLALAANARALHNLGMSLDDVVKLAIKQNGPLTLAAIARHGPALLALGLPLEGVLRLAAKERADEVLTAVTKHARAMFALEFTLDDVIKLADKWPVDEALTAVTGHGPALLELGVTRADILRVLAHRNSNVLMLDEMRQHTRALLDLGLPLGAVVDIAASAGAITGGWKVLEAVKTHEPALRGLGLELGHIVNIAVNGASDGLATVTRHAPELLARGVTPGEIVKIVALNHLQGGTQDGLHIMRKAMAPLLDLGLTVDDIVKIAVANRKYSAELQFPAVLKLAPAIVAMGLTLDDIVKIAASGEKFSAKFRLQEVQKHVPALLALGLPRDEIVRVAIDARDFRELPAIVAHLPALRQLGLTSSDICDIAVHKGASRTLHLIATRGMGQLTKAGLLAVACRDNGYKALSNILDA